MEMSTSSIISLPPFLEMTSRSIPLLRKKTSGKRAEHADNAHLSTLGNVKRPGNAESGLTVTRLLKLSETSFPLRENEAVNLKIMLHAAEQMSSIPRVKKGQPRGYPPPSNAMLFDDDPGIMSEVETSSTGFRRGGKQRSSLPVVRTPSKTLERPLGKKITLRFISHYDSPIRYLTIKRCNKSMSLPMLF
ncbi:unnamed protein product [Phaedon cochleariae]|uniref:Uncharacterized protein n=1 Tax=Phaedon cochleariae TaxID=80249 RepID=A0A9P0DTD7_PHACE|nr:unnamed protein product [Phaedon cochleariae]